MEIDPVTLKVIESRLGGIVAEMQQNIFRTGYSTIVRESQDASAMILDAEGNVVGEQVILPLHVSALPEVVRAIRARYPDLAPGDAFVTNHPYLAGVTHSIDMAVASPVFIDGELVAFCASIAHKSDLGGMVPGTGSGNAREIFQEGVLYPPVRIRAGGRAVAEVEAIIQANSRTPELVLGDLRGQIGTARYGAQRLEDLARRYGTQTLQTAMAVLQDHAEARVRAVLASWPDGTSEGEAWVDNDGVDLDRRIYYHVRVEKRGDHLWFDFSRSADQTRGPVNILPCVVRGCCYYALLATIDPSLPNNGGVARTVSIRTRRGSVLEPVFPAPTNTYMASATAVTEAVLQALNAFVPGRQVAGMGGVGGMVIGGRRRDGSSFVQYELTGAGWGARTGKDGVSGVSILLDNARTASIEVLETEFPVRVERFELIRDSGGPGRWRGGLGIRRQYRFLAPEGQLTLRGGKHQEGPFGVAGGRPGRPGAMILNPDGPHPQRLPSRFSGVRLVEGDVVRLEKAGGGGVGPPEERPLTRLIEDILDGYVSVEAAIAEWGADPDQVAQGLRAWEAGAAGSAGAEGCGKAGEAPSA
ncbi:MAG: hydantoinase B/oxoprolinase family protein [Firmicutes bacterium]|nr:hydantoinase B/oxoprolinase family protein [Bacillota bacterium]